MYKDLPYFISCDWGTSNLRLRLVKSVDLQILGEHISDQGIAKINKKWRLNDEGLEREDYFTDVILQEVFKLEQVSKIHTKGIPILCSGMASSSIGIKELPYATIPFKLNGSSTIVEKLVLKNNHDNDFWLISGLKSTSDLIRGEETEIIGISKIVSNLPDEYLVMIPGTHSKHIQIKNNEVTASETFMTGELFELLSKESMLKYSIEPSIQINWEYFDQGVNLSREKSLMRNLFTVRVNDLLNDFSKSDNYDYLSGLIIGAELTSLTIKNQKLALYGKGRILELYHRALQNFGLKNRLKVISSDDFERAIIAGQLEIYKNMIGK